MSALEASSSSAVTGRFPRVDSDDKKYHSLTITKFPTPTIWIQIPENEEFVVKPGAMLAYKNLEIETRVVKNCCSRFFCSNEDVVANTYTGGRGGGQILLEHDRLGQLGSHLLRRGDGMVLRDGAFMASSANIELNPQIGGPASVINGLGGMTYMKVDSTDGEPGAIYFKTRYGVMQEIAIRENEPVSVDNNNLIGFTDGLAITMKKTGGIATSIFGREGVVCEFRGNGTVFVGSNDKSTSNRPSRHND